MGHYYYNDYHHGHHGHYVSSTPYNQMFSASEIFNFIKKSDDETYRELKILLVDYFSKRI